MVFCFLFFFFFTELHQTLCLTFKTLQASPLSIIYIHSSAWRVWVFSHQSLRWISRFMKCQRCRRRRRKAAKKKVWISQPFWVDVKQWGLTWVQIPSLRRHAANVNEWMTRLHHCHNTARKTGLKTQTVDDAAAAVAFSNLLCFWFPLQKSQNSITAII